MRDYAFVLICVCPLLASVVTLAALILSNKRNRSEQNKTAVSQLDTAVTQDEQ